MKKLAALTLKAKIIIAAASAAVVAAAAVGTVMLLHSSEEETYRVVKVFETQGQYNTVERGTTGTLDAYSGMNLQNGDIVSTGADSNMRISLDGDKYILLDHNSEVQLVAENSSNDSKTIIELKKGEILNEITEPLSENSTYEVNTPKATMAVRGTSFYVQTEMLENGSYITDLEVIHGKVAVWLYDESGNKKGEEVFVQEGYKVTIVIDPNENTENSPDVDGNAYFVYRTEENGLFICGDTDPAPYKTDFRMLPDIVKQTALASDESGLLTLDLEIETILRGQIESTQTTTMSETTESGSETTEPAASETVETTVVSQTSADDTTTEITQQPVSETDPQTVTSAPSEAETTTTTTTAPEPETALVSFADRSGNIIEQREVVIGESIGTLPSVPSVAGHTGKWAINGEEISADHKVTDNVTVMAVYTINQYTVTYKTNEQGVTMPNAQTVDYGTIITLPTVPTKTGYTGEWQIDNKTVTGKYTVTDDVTVMAVYTINEYTVTFKSDETDVTMPEEQKVKYNETLTLPQVPNKTGYTGKWFIDGKEVTDTYVVTDDVTVKAVYMIMQFTVIYECVEAEPPEAETVDYGTVLTLPTMEERTGYTGKWTIDGEEIPEGYEVKSDITVKFEYVINTYEITFECDYDDVTMPSAITAEYGATLSEVLTDANVEIPEKKYYTGKWTVDGEDITGLTVEGNTTVKAEYTHINVSFSFEYIKGYSDDADYIDPYGLSFDSQGTDHNVDFNMTAAELQEYISGFTSNLSYEPKIVYDTKISPLENLSNIFDVEVLPEITEGMTISDIAYDYEYEGGYYSTVKIYLVPKKWTVHKVTFHDVDGEEIESHYTTDYGSLKELPAVPDGYTWVYYDPNQTLSEFYAMQSSVNADTDVYCGVKITAHSYDEDDWSEFGSSVCKMAGETLTDDDLKELAPYGETIAGFITDPVNSASDITEFYSAGQAVNSNIDLYIVKAKIDYTTLDGNSGTLYWLGDGSLMEKLNALRTSENYIWKFDNANGDVVSEDTLNSRMYYDDETQPDDPQTAARFKVVETAS